MRPNVEFWIELPKTNPGLAKSPLQQKTHGHAYKRPPTPSNVKLVAFVAINMLVLCCSLVCFLDFEACLSGHLNAQLKCEGSIGEFNIVNDIKFLYFILLIFP